jgi:hypothetical protein
MIFSSAAGSRFTGILKGHTPIAVIQMKEDKVLVTVDDKSSALKESRSMPRAISVPVYGEI